MAANAIIVSANLNIQIDNPNNDFPRQIKHCLYSLTHAPEHSATNNFQT